MIMFEPSKKEFLKNAVKVIDEGIVKTQGIKLRSPEKLSEALLNVGKLYEKYHAVNQSNF